MTGLERLVQLYKDANNRVDDISAEDFELVEEGDWEQEHKYQFRTLIVRLGEEHFAISETRSGSYHTDWYYGDAVIAPVERKVEVKEVVSWPSTGPSSTVPGKY